MHMIDPYKALPSMGGGRPKSGRSKFSDAHVLYVVLQREILYYLKLA